MRLLKAPLIPRGWWAREECAVSAGDAFPPPLPGNGGREGGSNLHTSHAFCLCSCLQLHAAIGILLKQGGYKWNAYRQPSRREASTLEQHAPDCGLLARSGTTRNPSPLTVVPTVLPRCSKEAPLPQLGNPHLRKVYVGHRKGPIIFNSFRPHHT